MKRLSDQSKSRVQLRNPRPRSNVGSPRRPDMVRPTFKTLLRQMLMNGKLAALALVVLSIGGLAFVFRSERFLVRHVEVSGNRSLSTADVLALAGVEGSSIWNIEPLEIATRINQNTYVANSAVTTLLPDRVLIRVQEHEAAILWQVAGINYEVAANGQVLGTSTLTDTNVLVIYDTRTTPLQSGAYIDADALDLVQALHLRLPTEQGWEPTRYEWDPYYGISIYNGTRQIAMGRMDDERMPLDIKLALLDELRADSSWIFLDVRSTKPYYRGPVTPTVTPTTTP